MRIFLIGHGGREHALAWKLAQEACVSEIFCQNANPGLRAFATPLPAKDDVGELCTAARHIAADLVLVGPEQPLCDGLADRLGEANIPCFGPVAAAARLESSKLFTRRLCQQLGLSQMTFHAFSPQEAEPVKRAMRHIATYAAPYVLKADGLAGGKGVVVADSRQAAHRALELHFAQPNAGTLLIEDFLEGTEASFFCFCDGEKALPLCTARDYKRAFASDTGPNTGGMGAIAPVVQFSRAEEEALLHTLIHPVLKELKRRGTPYKGLLYAGLAIGKDGAKLIEFNCRFGDPECQVIMRLLKDDLAPFLYGAACGSLPATRPRMLAGHAALIVMAAEGYPGPYAKGGKIDGIKAAEAHPGCVVFQAGVAQKQGQLYANGGRVLNISAIAPTPEEARRRAYSAIDEISWAQGRYRPDIGL